MPAPWKTLELENRAQKIVDHHSLSCLYPGAIYSRSTNYRQNEAALEESQNIPVEFFSHKQILFQNIPIFDYFFKINFKKL